MNRLLHIEEKTSDRSGVSRLAYDIIDNKGAWVAEFDRYGTAKEFLMRYNAYGALVAVAEAVAQMNLSNLGYPAALVTIRNNAQAAVKLAKGE